MTPRSRSLNARLPHASAILLALLAGAGCKKEAAVEPPPLEHAVSPLPSVATELVESLGPIEGASDANGCGRPGGCGNRGQADMGAGHDAAPGTGGRMGGGMRMGSMMPPAGRPMMGSGGPDPMSSMGGEPASKAVHHVGAKAFFLDLAAELALTVDQQKRIGAIKQEVSTELAASDRRVGALEEELWRLTASDAPKLESIRMKATEIGKLTAKRRKAYIDGVVRAAAVLDPGQRTRAAELAPVEASDPSMEGAGMGMGSMGHKGMGTMKTADPAQEQTVTGGKGMDGMGMGGMGHKGMGGMGPKAGMGHKGMGPKARMGRKGMGGMGMGHTGMGGMGMMGRDPGASAGMILDATSALPGFPGMSHIYHVGATGFYLDHPEHVMLTGVQRDRLEGIRDRASSSLAKTEAKIEDAEHQLFVLTAAPRLDADAVSAAVDKLAGLHVEARVDFIQAVGDAAQVLTAEQRQVLVGEASLSQTHGGR